MLTSSLRGRMRELVVHLAVRKGRNAPTSLNCLPALDCGWIFGKQVTAIVRLEESASKMRYAFSEKTAS